MIAMQNQALSPMDVLPAAIRLITQELRPWAGPKKQAVYDEIARVLSQAQRQIERRYKRKGTLPAMNMGITPPSDAESLREWGARLRTRREAAGLTRDQLARLAGVADSTIRNLETGRHRPTRQILMRLQSVPDLGIPSPGADPSAALATSPTEDELPDSFLCNCWFAPEYDSIQMAQDMVQSVNGRGGHVEQTHLYIDPASAAAWCAVTAQEAWQSGPGYSALSDCVRYIKELVDDSPLDVIGLGPGEARDEVRLVQNLAQEGLDKIRLFLLDISAPLLTTGYRHAAQVLGDLAGVAVYAIQGNFHNLPSYTGLFHSTGRRRIVSMFGYTFSNLSHEQTFLRNTLSVLSEGDFLLLNLPGVFTPSRDPDEILEKDRAFNRRSADGTRAPAPRMADFLTGVFKRHVRGLRSVRVENHLDFQSCLVPGSYAVDVRAHVRTSRGGEREFSLYYSRRYDPAGLDAFMARNGWEPIRTCRYSVDTYPMLLCLYRKSAGSLASPTPTE